jgi:hypothetical protein
LSEGGPATDLLVRDSTKSTPNKPNPSGDDSKKEDTVAKIAKCQATKWQPVSIFVADIVVSEAIVFVNVKSKGCFGLVRRWARDGCVG